MNIAILQFGGSNCDLDVQKALSNLGISAELIWYKETLASFDGVIIPGGFSYGDYLRAGAIAARTRIMQSVREIAADGRPVLGICNGAQILSESHLVPGTFALNQYPKFVCKWVKLKTVGKSPFTKLSSRVIDLPIAHKEGRYVVDPPTLKALYENDQIVFKYVDDKGDSTLAANPNGSLDNIAGISNLEKNVLAMMPHPERASEKLLGSDDGNAIFQSMIRYINALAT
ncbi:MAG TPA: phosphoribosylformylglycinamidine synthase I [Candidatus Bathyarchaeia archaeon]|nr:phosphoribosylformylglycinamidine synthase I [Candidatus Bathyarchaeia archaeon]